MKSIILIFIAIIVISGTAYAFDDHDIQYWNTENISWNIHKDWNLSVEEEFRFGDNVTDYYYQHSDFGITYSILEWLDLSLNYRLIFEEDDGDWDYESRPHYNVTAKHDILGFAVSNRSRFERRNREDTSDGWRYRNKSTIKAPKITKHGLQPYIADEFFVDLINDKLNTNRLYGGIGFKVFKKLKADIYYLWQAKESDNHWDSSHVIGTKLKLAF